MVYEDSEGGSTDMAIVDFLKTISTKRWIKLKMNVAATEEAIPLGDVGTLGYFFAINRDATNFINIKTGTGGTIIAKLTAGAPCLIPFGSGVTAPYAIADTAACQMEYFLCSV